MCLKCFEVAGCRRRLRVARVFLLAEKSGSRYSLPRHSQITHPHPGTKGRDPRSSAPRRLSSTRSLALEDTSPRRRPRRRQPSARQSPAPAARRWPQPRGSSHAAHGARSPGAPRRPPVLQQRKAPSLKDKLWADSVGWCQHEFRRFMRSQLQIKMKI